MNENSLSNKTLGRYELGELIGRGAMGEVYRATDPSLDRQLAIKVLPERLCGDQDFLDRFLTEARIAGRLQHPNIVSIYDFGQSDGVTYIAMQLVEGQTLDVEIAAGELPFPTIESVLRQLASALDYAHEYGFIHRDVKPGNIFITPDLNVLLMDFGIAKILEGDANLTSPGFMVGTPKYSAPEIHQGKT